MTTTGDEDMEALAAGFDEAEAYFLARETPGFRARCTAHHEAGHAIAAWHHGQRFRGTLQCAEVFAIADATMEGHR